MTSFVHNHVYAIINFDKFFEFLHMKYFSKMTFELIYLNLRKTHVFTKKLNITKFSGNLNKIRPFIKHCLKIEKWFIFTNKAQLNKFLWLILFLKQFIFKQTKHVLKIKKIYIIKMSIELCRIKLTFDIKNCDHNLTKLIWLSKLKIFIIRKQWMKKFNNKFV